MTHRLHVAGMLCSAAFFKVSEDARQTKQNVVDNHQKIHGPLFVIAKDNLQETKALLL